MKKAWIKNGFVQDICPSHLDPVFAYGKEIGANYISDIPDHVENGWWLNEAGVWVAPNVASGEPVPEPAPAPSPAPTKEELMAQIAALSAQIQALE